MNVLLVTTGIVLVIRPMLRLRQTLRFTSLIPAGYWALSAAILWSFTWMVDQGLRLSSPAISDHLWYASAVVSLCPAIAVLGSRRPGVRVWNWFILIPMLFALGWPVMTLLIQRSEVRGLQLETPQLIAYLLVLVMGAGNYFGTRHTFSGLLFVIANGLVVLSSSASCPSWLSDRGWARLWASGCMVLAVVLTGGRSPSQTLGIEKFDLLWLDFFDQFGVVWGRRIQDRVNFIAMKENWPARLELHGVQWKGFPDPVTEGRLEHTFRWLLRRFVDRGWIDQRIGQSSAAESVTALGADS